MEKLQPHKSKSNNNTSGHQVLKFLKAASSINFNNPPFSPSRDKPPSSDHKLHNYPHHRSGFSGPLLPRVPRAVPGKFKSGDSQQPEEPTSPTISCIGQIKHKTKKKTLPEKRDKDDLKKKKKHGVGSSSPRIWKIFGSGSFNTSDNEGTTADQSMPGIAPGLSQMRRFASGHRPDGFGNFDWTAQIAPIESDCRDYSDGEEEEEEEDDDDTVIAPFSTRIADVEGMSLKPRKEVNLWKRRTMDPPRPLQLVRPK
ncbi:Uncharacterized protein At1g76070 [Linum grandiflorum]